VRSVGAWVVADSEPIIARRGVVAIENIIREVKGVRHDHVYAVMEQAHGVTRGWTGFQKIADVVNALEFAAARRIAPIVDYIVAEICVYDRAEARIAALIMGDEIMVKG